MLLEDAIDRVRPAAEAARITIELDGSAPGAILACDRRQLVSAIANLLDNAVKYSESGSRVCLAMAVEDRNVVLTVTDQGIGIPSRDLERIFERFYRVDQARSRATGGTGLGLAIVRHVVQAHGGDVTVESVEGQGSTFRLVLPLEGIDSTARVHHESRH
jgi:two-component system sensor histidine kinase SenX3